MSQVYKKADYFCLPDLKKLALAIVLIAVCSANNGCTTLSSDLPTELAANGEAPGGIAYSLPMYVIDFALSVNPKTAQFSVKPSQPRAIAAPGHRYYLRYHPLPNYDDVIKVSVSGQSFLQSVSSNTKDRTADIILNLVKSVSAFGPAFEAAPASEGEEQLAMLTIDPTNETEMKRMVRSFNDRVKQFASLQVKTGSAICKGKTLPKPKKINKTTDSTTGQDGYKPKQPSDTEANETQYYLNIHNKSLCDEYKRIARTNLISISLKPIRPISSYGSSSRTDCSAGLCYRPPLPYQLSIKVYGSVTSSIVLVPNEAPLVSIDIERAFFINKVQTVQFDTNGALKSMAVKKDSELLAVSSFPLQVVGAVADSLRLRISVLDQQIADTNSRSELIQAKAELEKQRVLFAKAANQREGSFNAATSTSSILAPVANADVQSSSFLSQQTAIPGRTQ